MCYGNSYKTWRQAGMKVSGHDAIAIFTAGAAEFQVVSSTKLLLTPDLTPSCCYSLVTENTIHNPQFDREVGKYLVTGGVRC